MKRRLPPLILAAVLVAVAQPASAEKRFPDQSGAFAYVTSDDWAIDPDGNGLAIRCEGDSCGEAGAWCEAGVSGELPAEAVDAFLKGAPKDVDVKVRSSATADAKYIPTAPVARRTVGGKDGFYGEYDLKIAGEETLKAVVLHTYSKSRLVVLICFSDAERLPMIREIVEKSETPS